MSGHALERQSTVTKSLSQEACLSLQHLNPGSITFFLRPGVIHLTSLLAQFL